MKAQINLVTIWTNQIDIMKAFYHEVLGFQFRGDLEEGDYIEFINNGVRFAICSRSVMFAYSDEFKAEVSGQLFELAFPCDSIEDLEKSYDYLIEKGARGIQAPTDMPWNQRTALFADPDGNIHELFTEL